MKKSGKKEGEGDFLKLLSKANMSTHQDTWSGRPMSEVEVDYNSNNRQMPEVLSGSISAMVADQRRKEEKAIIREYARKKRRQALESA